MHIFCRVDVALQTGSFIAFAYVLLVGKDGAVLLRADALRHSIVLLASTDDAKLVIDLTTWGLCLII